MEQILPRDRTGPLSAGARYRNRLARYPERGTDARPPRKASFIIRIILLLLSPRRKKRA